MIEKLNFRTFLKNLRFAAEFFLAALLLLILRLLPIAVASSLCGHVAGKFGKFLRHDKYARTSIKYVMPEVEDSRVNEIAKASWENVGRLFGEFAHLNNPAMKSRMTIFGIENVEAAAKAGFGGIFVSAHYGNWELLPKVAADNGLPLVLVYRESNNPLTDKIIRWIRGPNFKGLYPKGRVAASRLLRDLKRGLWVGMLVDQKMNSGVELDFLGKPAMTATATAELAVKFNVPVIMARCFRLPGARFNVEIYPPIWPQSTGDTAQDVNALMQSINNTIGDWVREAPEQWLWLHRRWPKEIYKP